MAYQPINYANTPMMGLSPLLEGMQIGMAPAQELRKAQEAKLANELMRMEIKYKPKQMETELMYKDALRIKAEEEAKLQSMLMDMVSGNGAIGGGFAQAGASQDNAPQMDLFGQPFIPERRPDSPYQNTGNQGGYPSMPTFGQMLLNSQLRLPAVLPQQQLAMDRYKMDYQNQLNRENERFRKDLESEYLTGSRLSDVQGQVAGIEQLMPMFDMLATMDVPAQNLLSRNLNPNAQANYKNLVNSMKELMTNAMGQRGNIEAVKTTEHILMRDPLESLENYRARQEQNKLHLLDIAKMNLRSPNEARAELSKLIARNEQQLKSLHTDNKKETTGQSTKNDMRIPMVFDGKKYMIPLSEVEDAMKEGYQIGE